MEPSLKWHDYAETPTEIGLYRVGNELYWILAYWNGMEWMKSLKRDEPLTAKLNWQDRDEKIIKLENEMKGKLHV